MIAWLGVQLGLLAAATGGPPPVLEVMHLSTGESLTVEVLDRSEGAVRVRHPVLGELVLTAADITLTPITPTAPSDGSPRIETAAPELSPLLPAPATWKRTVNLGLAGAEGGTESANARIELSVKRASASMETAAGLGYLYATSDGQKSKNRGEGAVRHDWLWGSSPWGLFAEAKVEYDDFQDWDWRVSASSGPSYAVLRSDRTLLRLRSGLGLAGTFGGSDPGLTPEALVGSDLEHTLNDRHSMYAGTEFLPSLSAGSDYRINSRAGYRVLLDPQTRLSLVAGLANRFESTPGAGVGRNNFEYFLTVGWEF